MVEETDLKHWRDAGHVARRTLEGIKDEIIAGKHWNDVSTLLSVSSGGMAVRLPSL